MISAGGSDTYWHSFNSNICTCVDKSDPKFECPAWEERSGFTADAGGGISVYCIIGGSISITTPLETSAQ